MTSEPEANEVPGHHTVPWAAAALSLFGLWLSVNPTKPLWIAIFTFGFVGSLALRWIGSAVEQRYG